MTISKDTSLELIKAKARFFHQETKGDVYTIERRVKDDGTSEYHLKRGISNRCSALYDNHHAERN